MKITTQILHTMFSKGRDREYSIPQIQSITKLKPSQIYDALKFLKISKLILKRYERGYKDNAPFKRLYFRLPKKRLDNVIYILKRDNIKV